jgi:LCP family protein required for cell wall assembly
VLYASNSGPTPPDPAEWDTDADPRPDDRRRTRRRRPKAPLWARLLVSFGAVLMLTSGTAIVGSRVLIAQATKSVTQTSLLGGAGNQAVHHVNINGPVNILLVGTDGRPDNPGDLGRADSIIILHIPASHDQAYLVSIPRDTLVRIPAFPKTRYRGGQDKINAAFAFGALGGGGFPGGTELLADTIKSLYGIGFDAAAVVNFAGFDQVVDALGGVDLCVDEKVTSIHVGFTKNGKEALPFTQDADLRLHPVPGVTPEVYNPGCQHLAAWQALDYARQRDLLANGDGDYGRQRHQQQFLKAVFKQVLSSGTLTSPAKLAKVLDTVGKAMTIDTGGISIGDWIYAMRGITGSGMTTIKTNDGQYDSINVPGIGACEQLTDTSLQLLQSVKDDNVAGFITQHPDWVSQS